MAMNMQMACEALCDAELFTFEGAASESARAMTAAALPHANGGHSFQKEVLELACSILLSAEQAAAAESRLLGEQAVQAEGEIRKAKDSVQVAEKATEEAHKTVEDKTAAVKSQKAKVREAVSEEKRTAGEHKRALASHDELASQKCAADSALAMLETFEAGQLEDVPVDGIIEILTSANAERTLLDTMPVLLTLPREKRGEFDIIAFNEVLDVLREYIGKLADTLSQAERHLRDAFAEALGCEALREVEEERLAAAETALDEAQKATEARTVEEQSSRDAVTACETLHSKHLTHQVLADEKAKRASAVRTSLLSPPAEVEDVVMTPADAAEAKKDQVINESEAMEDVLMRVARPTVV